MNKELNAVGAAFYCYEKAREIGKLPAPEIEALRLKYESALAALTDRTGVAEMLVNIKLTVTGERP